MPESTPRLARRHENQTYLLFKFQTAVRVYLDPDFDLDRDPVSGLPTLPLEKMLQDGYTEDDLSEVVTGKVLASEMNRGIREP